MLPGPLPIGSLGSPGGALLPVPTWAPQGSAAAFTFSEAANTLLDAIPPWVSSGGLSTARVSPTVAGTLDLVAGGTETVYTYETGSTSHWIEADLLVASDNSFPLAVRVIDTSNFVGVRAATAGLQIYQRVAGTFTQIGTTFAATPSVPCKIRIEATSNNKVRVYAAGNLLAEATIPGALAAATKAGVVVRSSSVLGALDNLAVYAGPSIHGVVPGGWCWFADPQVISTPLGVTPRKTWWTTTRNIGFRTESGVLEIHEYNHDTGIVTSKVLVTAAAAWNDDHCVAGIAIRPDGRLVVAFSTHQATGGVRVRISVNPYDASGWSAVQQFNTGESVSYPAPFFLSGEANACYVFFRDAPRALACIISTDLATVTPPASDGAAAGTITFGAKTTWTDCSGDGTAQGIYHKIVSDGVSRIDIAATNTNLNSSAGSYADVRHVYWQGGALRGSDGTALGAFPVAFSSWTPIATSKAPDNLGDLWVSCLTRDPQKGVIQVGFWQSISGGVSLECWYSSWDGSAWSKFKVPNTTSTTIARVAGQPFYSPGISVDPSRIGVAYIGVGPTGGPQKIYRYITTDKGATWSRSLMSPDDITGDQYGGQNFRPQLSANKQPSDLILWLRGAYFNYFQNGDPDFQSYACEVMVVRG